MADLSNSGSHTKVLAGAGHSVPPRHDLLICENKGVDLKGWPWRSLQLSQSMVPQRKGEKDKIVDRNIFLDPQLNPRERIVRRGRETEVGRNFLFIKSAP